VSARGQVADNGSGQQDATRSPIRTPVKMGKTGKAAIRRQ
jgi:hypothetical protein